MHCVLAQMRLVFFSVPVVQLVVIPQQRIEMGIDVDEFPQRHLFHADGRHKARAVFPVGDIEVESAS